MEPKKKILLLIPNLNFGGAQRVFFNQSLALSKKFDVTECVFNFDLGHAFVSGNKVVSLGVPGGTNLISKIYNFYLRCRRLRNLKREIQPDLCISHLEGADLVNVLSQVREQTITWVHGSKKYDENISGLVGFVRHHFMIPFTLRRASKVITVSNGIKDELVQFYGIGPEKICTVYNYFDATIIHQKSKESIPDKFEMIFRDSHVIIFSGRLAKQKNPLNLLLWFDAFSKVNDAKLLIIGDGELRNDALALCDNLNIETYDVWRGKALKSNARIFFLGFQENPFQYISRSTIFLLPSLWEGFPMVIGEALFCGKPVVSADCPTGPREMLSEMDKLTFHDPHFAEYGILMPLLKPENFDQWTNTVSMLLKDNDLLSKYQSASLGRSVKFSSEHAASEMTKVIESIIC